MNETGGISLHDPDGSIEGVRHVHHVQTGIRSQEARIASMPDRLVEDLDRVVRGTSASRRHMGDKARVAHTPRVHTKAVVIVIAEELARDLGHPVHGVGTLDRVLGSVIAGVPGPNAPIELGKKTAQSRCRATSSTR